ncbi:NAD-dependent epimerase/dehydratase family protein [Nonomuraea sp. NPDC049269]|uniref:NAD-dependent epimerase/dehydratase family protein n=1 Tax=Nonomuraea sp. NPDC049269 TaxID=3364349 RepID=UPI00371869FF
MGETVLVTGGTGFVAGWCVAELLRRGYTVRTTVRSPAKKPVDPSGRLTVFVADLTSDAGWDEAVAGCDYVLHVASPLGGGNSKDPDELIVPARDGALRVLKAATEAQVKRVVMTSSCAAATPPPSSEVSVIDETVWTDIEGERLNAYRKSKVVSERAAWRFMESYEGPTTLTTVLPGAVFGPVLSADNLGSVQVIGRLVRGRILGVPRLGFNIVDVRDLADLHLRAMTSTRAAGQRFIAVSEFMWMADVAKELRSKLGATADKVPARVLPDFLFRLIALFDPGVRAVTPNLGRKHLHTSEKAQRLLGWRPRPAATTVVDCAESLLMSAT